MKLWNYYKTAFINTDLVFYPQTEEELATHVKTAHQEKRKLRVMGAKHSQMGIMFGEDINISLQRYNRVISIENTTVTIEAGIDIGELNPILAKHGLSLPNFGSSAHPTFVGLMLAGSHGGSLKYGTFGSIVTSLRLIKYDGSIITVTKDDPIFQAILVSVGMLGVISSVTFEASTGTVFSSLREHTTLQDIKNRWEHLCQTNDYIRCLWYPITGDVEVWTAKRGASNSTLKLTDCADRRVSKLDLFLAPIIVFFISYCKQFQLAITKQFVRRKTVAYEGNATDIFAIDDGGNPLFHEAGIAVSYSDTVKAIEALDNHFKINNDYPFYPIEFRPCPANDAWLGTAYHRDITAFAILSHRHGKYDPKSFYDSIHTALKPFNYRVHWGMWINESSHYLSQQYEKWDDFLKLREKMDPELTFEQPILRKLFGFTL